MEVDQNRNDIREYLKQNPGSSAREISTSLSLNRGLVNSVLYRSNEFIRSSNNRWDLITGPPEEEKKEPAIKNDNYKYWPYRISKTDQRTGQIIFTEITATIDREFTRFGYGLSFQEDEARPEEGNKFSPIWNLTNTSVRYNGPTFHPGTSVKVVLAMKPRPTSGFYFDIVNIDFSGVNIPASIASPKTVSGVAPRIDQNTVAPRRILSDPLVKEFQTSFKQSCQVPPELVRNIQHSNVEDSLVRLASQWRLDYSRPKYDSEDDLSILLSICDKVLNRGSLSFCSPDIEQLVQMAVPPTEILPKSLSYLGPSKSEGVELGNKFDFDVYNHVSDEESMFMDILSSWIQSGQIDPWYVIPQIHISSLTKPKNLDLMNEVTRNI